MSVKKIILHQVLKELMKSSGDDIRVLSKDISVPYSTIASLLQAPKKQYNPLVLSKLSKKYNVTIDYLLFKETSAQSNLNTIPVKQIFKKWLLIEVKGIADDIEEMFPNLKNNKEVK